MEAESARVARLYRHFAANGDLLYVGISCKPITRLKQHEHDSCWAAEIARVDVQQFATRGEALAAERAAIKAEKPKHNIVHARGECSKPAKSGKPVESLEGLQNQFLLYAAEIMRGKITELQAKVLLISVREKHPSLWRRTMRHMDEFGDLNSGAVTTLLL